MARFDFKCAMPIGQRKEDSKFIKGVVHLEYLEQMRLGSFSWCHVRAVSEIRISAILCKCNYKQMWCEYETEWVCLQYGQKCAGHKLLNMSSVAWLLYGPIM